MSIMSSLRNNGKLMNNVCLFIKEKEEEERKREKNRREQAEETKQKQ